MKRDIYEAIRLYINSESSMGRFRTNIIVLFLGVILIVWTMSMLGSLKLAEVLTYDTYVKSIPETDESQQVLLVETPVGSLEEGGEYWNAFLDELAELGAEQVVFLFMPPKADYGFYKRAVADGDVVFGRSKQEDGFHDKVSLSPIPTPANRLPVIYGLVALPPSFYGVHRHYAPSVYVGGASMPSIVSVAMEDRFGTGTAPKDEFLVDFNGLGGGLPIVESGDVIKGKLVKQLVEGKSVVVGLKTSVLVPGLETPISLDNQGMGNLDYVGYALNTQLKQRHLSALNASAKLGVIALSTLIALVIFHYASVNVFMVVIAVLSVFYILATWFVFYSFGYWCPIVEIALAQFLCFLMVLRIKINRREATVQLTVLETLHLIREKVHPASFMASKEHWAQVLNLVNQTLYMNRVIFLEPVEKDHRVKEIIALNCSIDDIEEMRRDYQRSPYTWALETNGPVEVKKFLKGSDKPEMQFLVPLIFAGHLEGFWAFSIAPGSKDTVEQFLKTVRDFAEEIATMLYKRRQWILQENVAKDPIRKLIKLEEKQGSLVEIKKAISFFSRRIEILEDALNTIETSVLVYDLFGNVLMINDQMTTFLERHNLPAFELTALDLAVRLTGKRESEIRPKLRYLTIYNEEINIPLDLDNEADKNLILSIRPLSRPEGGKGDGTSPFTVQGILFEIVDLSDIKEAYRFKEEFFKYTNFHLKNDLALILEAINSVESEELTEEKRRSQCQSVKELVTGLSDFTGQLPRYADFEVMARTGVLPVNPRTSLDAALRDVSLESADFKNRCEVLQCEVYTLVNANPIQLVELLRAILKLLEKDSEAGAIVVEIIEKEEVVTIRLSDEGFGLPDDKFQEYLFGDSPLQSNDYQVLQKAMVNLGHWGGRLEASSEVGGGYVFELNLAKFYNKNVSES